MRHRLFRALPLLLIAIASLGLAGCDSESAELAFPFKTNDARAAADLAELSISPPNHEQLKSKARQHAQAMCDAGEIYHVSSLSEHYEPASGWTRLGENVGVVGYDPNASTETKENAVRVLFDAFMDSPGHRDNLLGDFTHQIVGEHVCTADNKLYVTHFFAKY